MTDTVYNAKWTPEEDEAMRTYFSEHGSKWEGWKTLLPGRTWKAIACRAHILGLTLRPEIHSQIMQDIVRKRRAGRWTRDEEAILHRHFPRHPIDWEGWDELLPNRTKDSIRAHAYSMGLVYRGSVIRIFSEGERKMLLKAVLKLSETINATPYDVAMELVELGKEWERQAAI